MGYINERTGDNGELIDDGPDGFCNECDVELIEVGGEQAILICPQCGN